MEPRLIDVNEQKQMIPDDEVRSAFLRRDDIKKLPRAEAAARWLKHLEKLNGFREALAKIPAFEVS